MVCEDDRVELAGSVQKCDGAQLCGEVEVAPFGTEYGGEVEPFGGRGVAMCDLSLEEVCKVVDGVWWK